MSDPTYKPRDPMDEAAERLAKAIVKSIAQSIARIYCGTFTLGVLSLLALGLMAFLLFVGVSSQTIEKGMVWLSVPWFALCYAACKLAHGTEMNVTDESEKAHPPLT